MAKFSPQQSMITLVLVIVALCLVPVFTGAVSNSAALAEMILFILVDLAWVLVYFRWLRHHTSGWAQTTSVLACWTLATAFVALFSDQFSNAYLAYLIGVQLMFAFHGLRYGLLMLGLTLASTIYSFLTNQNQPIAGHIFAFSVLAASGLLSWHFVSIAERTRDSARRLAAQVTRLTRLTLSAQDNERRRLARDVHDGPLQSLGVQLLAMDRIERHLGLGDMEKVQSELRFLREIARDAVDELRDTVNTLRNTLLDNGIEPALRNFARRFEDSTGVEVQVFCDLADPLREELQMSIYPIAVEALNNVRKHARARSVSMRLWQKGADIRLTVRDDGLGFDHEATMRESLGQGHIGLYTMRERAAELGGDMSISSAPGRGTELSFCFPRTAPASPTLDESPLEETATEPHHWPELPRRDNEVEMARGLAR